MSAEITPAHGSVHLEARNLYVPWVVSDHCANCPNRVHRYLASEPLMYPTFNEPITLAFSCDVCDYEWDVKIQLNLSLSVVG